MSVATDLPYTFLQITVLNISMPITAVGRQWFTAQAVSMDGLSDFPTILRAKPVTARTACMPNRSCPVRWLGGVRVGRRGRSTIRPAHCKQEAACMQ